MATPYEKVYDSFLPKLQSYDIATMADDEVIDYMHDLLMTAINNFHVCHKDLHDVDEDKKQFNEDLSSIEIEILSNYMVLAYVDATYVRTPTLLKVSLSSSDFNSFSNANHLSKLTEMQQRFLGENEALVTRYAWLDAGSDTKLNKLKFGYRW